VEGKPELRLNGWEIGRDLRNPSIAIQAAYARLYFPLRRHAMGTLRLLARPHVSTAHTMSQGCQGVGCELRHIQEACDRLSGESAAIDASQRPAPSRLPV
jgi:hypothetical protein